MHVCPPPRLKSSGFASEIDLLFNQLSGNLAIIIIVYKVDLVLGKCNFMVTKVGIFKIDLVTCFFIESSKDDPLIACFKGIIVFITFSTLKAHMTWKF